MVAMSRHSQQRTLTLLELFVQSSGSLHAHSLLSQLRIDEELLPVWHVSMLTYITLIGKSCVVVAVTFHYGVSVVVI